MLHIKIVAGRRNSTNEGPPSKVLGLGGFGVLGVLGFWGVFGGSSGFLDEVDLYMDFKVLCLGFWEFWGYWGFGGFLDGVDLRI